MTEKKNYCDADGRCTADGSESSGCRFHGSPLLPHMCCLHEQMLDDGYFTRYQCTNKQARAEAGEGKSNDKFQRR